MESHFRKLSSFTDIYSFIYLVFHAGQKITRTKATRIRVGGNRAFLEETHFHIAEGIPKCGSRGSQAVAGLEQQRPHGREALGPFRRAGEYLLLKVVP